MSAPALNLVGDPPVDDPAEERFTEEQLAGKFRRSINTLRRWRAEGVLPFHRRGKTVWFTREDIATFERRSAVDHGRRPAR